MYRALPVCKIQSYKKRRQIQNDLNVKPVNLCLLIGRSGSTSTHLRSGMRFGIGRIVIVISEAPTAGSLSKDQQGHSNDEQDHGQNNTNNDTNHATFQISVIIWTINIDSHSISVLRQLVALNHFAFDVKGEPTIGGIGINALTANESKNQTKIVQDQEYLLFQDLQ